MAINWNTQISQVNVQSKRANIQFTRTDSENPADVFSKSYSQVIIDTAQQRTALLEQVWTAWQQELTDRSNVAAFVTNLEQLANSNLDAREV